jgi:uncharacterized protein YneF (UPF0154 family)
MTAVKNIALILIPTLIVLGVIIGGIYLIIKAIKKSK